LRPDTRIAEVKDGRTHLAHKAGRVADLETGTIVAVTLQELIKPTRPRSRRRCPKRLSCWKPLPPSSTTRRERAGYHRKQIVLDVQSVELRTDISERDSGRQNWIDQQAERGALRATEGSTVDAATG
jgi:transposase